MACTFAQLVDRCEPARFVGKAPASPFVVNTVLARVAPTLAADAFGTFASAPDFARAAGEVISHLKSQNATVQLLRDAAGRAEGTVQRRALALASLWESVDLALDSNGLLDRADVLTVATRRLLTQGLPPRLSGLDELEVAFVHDLFPARLSFLEALAKVCRRQGVRFMLTWPGVGRDEVDLFVAQAIRHIEHRWELDPFDLQLHRSNRPLEWVAEQLFVDDPRRAPAPELSAFSAATARDEVREMARRVKRLVQDGTPPERVAVVFRDLASDTEAVLEAFEDLGVPTRARLGVPLASSRVGRLALSVFALVDDAFPVEAVTAWLSSKDARAPVACGADAAKWLTEAGIRDDDVGRSDARGAYDVRLGALAKRLEGQLEATAPQHEGRRQQLTEAIEAVRQVHASCTALIRLARGIPLKGRYRTLLDAWWRALEQVGLFAALSQPDDTPLLAVSALSRREIDRAVARDQAAAEALLDWRTRLVEALQQSGLGDVEVDRRAFAGWLQSVAADVNLAARGPRTGAVWLLDARELAGREFDHVFVGGMVDGRFPGRPPPLQLLGEDQRKALNVLAKQPLFRLGVAEGDLGLPLRLAEDRLLFHHVLSAANERVVLSRSRFDEAGRAALASPFFDALARVVDGFSVEVVGRQAVPELDAVASESDLRVRVALEVAGPPETRQTARDSRREALAHAFGAEGWLAWASTRGAAETERLRYFSSDDVPPGPMSGRLTDPEVLAHISQRFRYSPDHPVSANELKDLANCGFQALARRVLRVQPASEQPEEIAQSGRGSFLHRVLYELVPALGHAGLLTPGVTVAQLEPFVKAAVTKAAEVVERERGTGHPRLWAIAQARAAKMASQYVDSDVMFPIEGARPAWFESEFGAPHSPPSLRHVVIRGALEGEDDVYVAGTIDRLDVGEQVAGVVDYKAGRAGGATERATALFAPDFQLPIYALAVRQAFPDLAVTAAWVGLRKRESTNLLEILNKVGVQPEELLSMAADVRASMRELGRPNVANAVHGLLALRRGGDFGPRPVDCRSCELQPVCRISSRRIVAEGPPGEGS